MRRVERALRSVVADLDALGRSFALVGGFAVSARTEPRTTRDVDLAVVVEDDTDAEQLTFELSQRGYALKSAIEQAGVGRLATVRMQAPQGSIVDLLFASSGIEREIVEDAESLSLLGDFRVPIPLIGHLIALKVLARDDRNRPQDRLDLRALLSVASDGDLVAARSAVELIERRGYARGKQLVAELDRTIEELAPNRSDG